MTWLLALPIATALFANVPTAEPTIEPPGVDPATAPFASPPPEPTSHWYGAPALAVDGGVLVGVLVAGTYEKNPSVVQSVLLGATAIYLLDGPVVHLLHGHAGRSAGSFLLRAGTLAAAVVGGLALLESSGCNGDSFPHASACDEVGWGMALSPAIAMLVDDLVLARERVEPQPPARNLSPRVLVQPGLAMFGVGGSF